MNFNSRQRLDHEKSQFSSRQKQQRHLNAFRRCNQFAFFFSLLATASGRQETEIHKKAFRNYILAHKPYVKYVTNAFESYCFRALFQVTQRKYLRNVEMEVNVLHKFFFFFFFPPPFCVTCCRVAVFLL